MCYSSSSLCFLTQDVEFNLHKANVCYVNLLAIMSVGTEGKIPLWYATLKYMKNSIYKIHIKAVQKQTI